MTFPASGEIIEYAEGFAIAAPHERETPFHDTEVAFLKSVIRSDLHVVYNIWGAEEGYLGESTAVETVRAMAVGVPTVWLRPPERLSPQINGDLGVFARRACGISWVEPLDKLPDTDLKAAIGRLTAREVGTLPWATRHTIDDTGNLFWEDDSELNWPVSNDDEHEIFYDVMLGLKAKYAESWQKYQLAKT